MLDLEAEAMANIASVREGLGRRAATRSSCVCRPTGTWSAASTCTSVGDRGRRDRRTSCRTSACGRGFATRAVLLAVRLGFPPARPDAGLPPRRPRQRRHRSPSPNVPGFTLRGHRARARRCTRTASAASTPASTPCCPTNVSTSRPATLADVDFLTDARRSRRPMTGPLARRRRLGRRTAPASVEWTESRCAARSRTAPRRSSRRRRRRRPAARRTDRRLVELAGLQLLPAHQGRGLGSQVIRELMAEAATSGRASGCRSRRTTCVLRRCTNGSGSSSSARTARSR